MESVRHAWSLATVLHITTAGQAGGRDSVGSTVFVHSPSTLLDREPQQDRSLVTDIRVDHDVMWLVVGFDKHLHFCIGFSNWPFTAVHA